MAPFEDVVRLAVAALSILVFVVGLLAYVRRPTARMGVVLLLFTAFLAQGVILFVEIFLTDTPVLENLYYIFQFIEIALVAAIILKR